MSIKRLMMIALLNIQMLQKITYIEEEASQRGGAGYKIRYEFMEEVRENIRETLPVPFLWHVMQQAINLAILCSFLNSANTYSCQFQI